MPRGDGTGPMSGGCGRGFRNRVFATGQPFGQRFGACAPYEPADQKSFLQNQATALENELKQIRDRLSKIEDKE